MSKLFGLKQMLAKQNNYVLGAMVTRKHLSVRAEE